MNDQRRIDAAEAETWGTAPALDTSLAAVVIGRNEGARLSACLASLRGGAGRVVYVDSGSTDGSVELAVASGAEVVALDPAIPFTAARARNAGLAKLGDTAPAYVHFVDGDCAVREYWVATARVFLDGHPEAAVAAGRRRERRPAASIYNLLCDWEWNTRVGRARACGGDALVRYDAIVGIGGYADTVIAAEDDEMCCRLRAAGWEIWRLDHEMTWHDAAIHRFGAWWRRATRAGHGFAQVGALHPDHFVAERRRVWLWGAVLPAAALLGLLVAPWVTAVVAVLYAASFARVTRRFMTGGMGTAEALKCAGLITLSKFANLQGVLTYHLRRLRGEGARIIEYK